MQWQPLLPVVSGDRARNQEFSRTGHNPTNGPPRERHDPRPSPAQRWARSRELQVGGAGSKACFFWAARAQDLGHGRNNYKGLKLLNSCLLRSSKSELCARRAHEHSIEEAHLAMCTRILLDFARSSATDSVILCPPNLKGGLHAVSERRTIISNIPIPKMPVSCINVQCISPNTCIYVYIYIYEYLDIDCMLLFSHKSNVNCILALPAFVRVPKLLRSCLIDPCTSTPTPE